MLSYIVYKQVEVKQSNLAQQIEDKNWYAGRQFYKLHLPQHKTE